MRGPARTPKKAGETNHPQPTFVMKTEPRRSSSDDVEAEEVSRLAFSKYARRIDEVEEEIARRWTADPFPPEEVVAPEGAVASEEVTT